VQKALTIQKGTTLTIPNNTDVDIFADLASDEDNDADFDTTDANADTDTDSNDEVPGADSETGSADEESLTEIPDGALSVQEFAELLTFADRRPFGYVLPQSVYQWANAKNGNAPVVKVKMAGEKASRTYILNDSNQAVEA